MAKDVKFTIKLKIDGKEMLVEASSNAKKFAQQLGIARGKSDELRSALLNFNQITQTFRDLSSGLQEVLGVVHTYTAGYAEQVEVEAKLANNMRNTMAAREEDIQSIKDLCSAQQELGVVGDEIQLAGAQELATYLEKRSSLEKLIPVMNDMVAQQYGLNATSEAATNIATMLGKVMDGQVGALSRYGYKFDEAQAQILKFGTEEERAAVLAEVVESAVGGMNESLARTDAGRMKQVANSIGDIKEKIGPFLAELEPAVSTISEFGAAIVSVTTAMRGLTGVATITARGVGGLLTAASNTTIGFHALLLEEQTLMKASKMLGVEFGVLKVAVRGLLAATGVGLAIAALTVIIEKMMNTAEDATDSLDNLTRAQRSLEDAHNAGERKAAAMRIELDGEKEKLEELIGSNADATTAISELNNKYGEAFGYHKTAAEWYDILTKKSEDYCEQLMLQAEAQAIADKMVENTTAKRENFRKQERLRKDKKDKDTSFSLSEALGFKVWRGDSDEMKEAKNEAKELVAEGRALNEEWEKVKGNIKEVGKRLGDTKATPKPTKQPRAKTGKLDKSEERPLAEGSIDWYEKRLQEIRGKITETSDEALAASLQSDYKAVEAELKDLKIRVGLEKPDKAETKTYMETLRDELTDAQMKFNNATTVQAKVEADAEITRIQSKIDEATKGKVTISADVQPAYIEAGSITDKRQSYSNAQQKATRIQQDYEIGVIGKDQALSEIAEINLQLEKMGMHPIEIEVMTEDIERARKRTEEATESFEKGWGAVKGIGGGIQSMTEALEGNGDAWSALTGIVDGFIQIFEGIRMVVQIINALTAATKMQTGAEATQAAATTANTVAIAAETGELAVNTGASLSNTAAKSGEAIAGATASGASMPFPYNLIAIAAGVAAVIAALAQIGSFATGGIVGGSSPTGDRLLARVNSGEMILNKQQQARLFKLLNGNTISVGHSQMAAEPQAVNLNVSGLQNQLQPIEIRVSGSLKGRGRDLLATIETEQNHKKRS